MNEHIRKEQATMWHDHELGNLEILHATYIKHTFARHAHETFAIGLVEAGAGKFYARGTTHTAASSDIFIIHPDDIHDGHATVSTGYTYRMLYPHPELFQHFGIEPLRSSLQTPFFPHTVIKDKSLYDLLLMLHKLFEHSSGRLERETVLSQVLTYLLTTHATLPTQRQTHVREHHAIALVKDYVHAHYDQAVSLDQLSTLTQLHPSYLVRTFHAAMGVPPHVYLNHVRILQAKRLLLDGVPTGQVAIEMGFADQSHLTRHFKRLIGVPPGQYVRNVKNIQDKIR
jgi:AraC-like DNA-binding protein